MATFTHALGHTLDGKLRGGEPDIKQMHKIAQFMGLRHECVITSCCQGGFNRKGHSFLEESLDAVEHDTPRLYGHALGTSGKMVNDAVVFPAPLQPAMMYKLGDFIII